MSDVPAIIKGTNATLIAAVAKLGYIKADDRTLDMTYGRGVWWREWSPDVLYQLGPGNDFRHLNTKPDDHFDVVAFDPPYRLNGTPDRGDFDERYGIDVPMRWQDKHQLIRDGIDEALRVLKPGGRLLLKCQDQVCSGKVRWQTQEFTDHAERVRHKPVWSGGEPGARELLDFKEVRRCELVDALLLHTPLRPQPPGRRQLHARRCYSTLLIFEKS